MNKSEGGSEPGQDTSAEYEIIDGHRVSPHVNLRETIKRKTGETMERRTRRLLEGYHLAEDSARQADVEKACGGLRPSTGCCGCMHDDDDDDDDDNESESEVFIDPIKYI